MIHSSSTLDILKIFLGVLLILLGFCLLISVITLPRPDLWVSAIAMIVGLTMLSPSEPKTQIVIGLGFFAVGAFTALRTLDIITRPWLQYGLGGFLFLLGVTLIIHSAIGGAQHKQETP
jgi:membrane-bound ClpP family serine protease